MVLAILSILECALALSPNLSIAPSNRSLESRSRRQNLEYNLFPEEYLANPVYQFSMIIPREIFDKTYPANPRNFGERLRKARMDPGLKIGELAELIGVTEDTVVNWELRGRRPMRRRLRQAVECFVASNGKPGC